ncbi:MAG TPA: DUF2652 domain-containing protein [Acidimicrobiia bacterium]|nr:DUF2652 domain-containing protein [Acidimicrobiia bacterium]
MATERACLVIADISGYTRYLAEVELDHAQDVLADLITTVVKSFRPRFRLAKLEGDAAFVYAPVGSIDGSILMDKIEGCYFDFRQRLLSIRQASVCECQACLLIPTLNLKMVAHHGDVAIQSMAGSAELVGTDVVLAHRLLKNSIENSAYALFTDTCIEATGLDPEALGMARHRELYEHVGEVGGWVHDLEKAWREMRERRRVYVSESEATLTYSEFYAVPPELVWEYVSVPTLRAKWGAGLERVEQLDPGGRRRPGTVNHCMHGEDVLIQEYVDWRPPKYHTSKVTFPDGKTLTGTLEVKPVEGGATLYQRLQVAAGERAAFLEEMRPMFDQAHEYERGRLAELLEEALRSQVAPSEPELPTPDESQRLKTSIG